MVKMKRILDIKLPQWQSAFLWGPRKTGKTTYLKEKFSQSIYYDFLKTDLFFDLSKNPSLLREQLLVKLEKEPSRFKYPVILDEVQKIPQILDEVHWLIENKRINFILCGSSARKLKRSKSNLLGGRAWRYEMFPLTTVEIEKPSLLRILNHGLIPQHYLQKEYKKSLQGYVYDYLKEEVFAEGLSRNISAFSRFLDAVGYSHGQIVNYSNIARDCGVDAKTVKEYYQILEDTLLGRKVEPFKKRGSRSIITSAPKFYLFDVGVAGIIIKRNLETEKGEEFGRAFEHFIFMELCAYRSYREKDFEINYWRTKTGYEVDFVLAKGEVAVEVKGSSLIDKKDLKSLFAFDEKYSPKKLILVSNEKYERKVKKIYIKPWRVFLEELWKDKVV